MRMFDMMNIRSTYWRSLLALFTVPVLVACAIQETVPPTPPPGSGLSPGALRRPPQGPEPLGPQIIVGRNGDLALFWMAVEWRKSWDILFSRSEDQGKTWLPPLSLKPDKDTVAGGVAIATDSKGRLYVAWRQWDVATKQRRILLLRSQDGGRSWDPSPKELASSPTLGFPRLLADTDGTVLVAWLEGPKSNRHLEITFSRDHGQTFEAKPALLSAASPQSKGGMSNVRIASDREGHIYVVWEEDRKLEDTRIYMTRSFDHGGSWAAEPIQLAPHEGSGSAAYYPSLHAARGGRVAVAWYQFETRTVGTPGMKSANKATARVVHLNRSLDAGETWLAQPVRLNAIDPAIQTNVESLYPELRSDRDGHLYAAWIEVDGSEPKRILFAHSPDFGSTWSTPPVQLELTSRLRAQPYDQLLRNDDAGRVWVLWQEQTNAPYGWHLLMNRSEDYGQTWLKQAMLVTDPSHRAGTIRGVALEGYESGRLFVTWDGGRKSDDGIAFNRSDDNGESWLPHPVRIDHPQ